MAQSPKGDRIAAAEGNENPGEMEDEAAAAGLNLNRAQDGLADIEDYINLGIGGDADSCYSLFPHLPVGGLAEENNTRGQVPPLVLLVDGGKEVDVRKKGCSGATSMNECIN